MNNWKKGIAQWSVGDTLYLSVPFTWLRDDAQAIADEWKKGKVIMGGPAFMEPSQCEGFEPLLFHNPCATSTTRGCPNACGFCAVSKLEPDYSQIPDYRPAPVICDNNFTAATRKHQELVVQKQKVFRLTDFNQGLEASKFRPELADLLGGIRCKVRFAFDSWGSEGSVKDAIDLCRERATKNIGVYVLIGYNDNPESARARLELVKSWGIQPAPMRYQPLDATKKDDYVLEGWTDKELRKMVRYYFRQNWFSKIPYDEFQFSEQGELF